MLTRKVGRSAAVFASNGILRPTGTRFASCMLDCKDTEVSKWDTTSLYAPASAATHYGPPADGTL